MSAEVLADTAVWIAFFRRGRGDETQQRLADALEQLILEDRVVFCGVVEMELLQGARDAERAGLGAALSALDYVEATHEDFRQAGELLGSLRRRGVTIPATDGLIAAQCVRRGIILLENDKHFGEVEGLRRYGWRT